MKRWFISCAVLLMGIFLAGNSLSATYDATGEWDITASAHWNNCGESNPGTEQSVGIIIQNGDNFTIIMNDRTITGTVSGNVYTATDKWYEDEGWTTGTFTVTASSSTQASGSVDWTWSDGVDSCSGGNQLSMTRRAQNPPTYDATGTWNYSDSDHWNNCGEPNEPPSSGTATLTQSGNRITLVGDPQETYYGFVNGPNYTFARSYPEDNGITSEVYRVTLVSGGTSGSGTGNWVWNDDYGMCTGGFNFSILKQEEKVKSIPGIPLLLLDD